MGSREARTTGEKIVNDARTAGVVAVAESHHVWERTCKQVERDWLAGTPCRLVTHDYMSESRWKAYQTALEVVKA